MFNVEPSRGQKRKWTEEDTRKAQYGSRSGRDRQHRQGNDSKGWSASEQAKINKIQEEDRHREFLAKETQFVLHQKRKAAEIRIKEGRARPIDWLATNLRVIDPIQDLINEDVDDAELDYTDPEVVIADVPADQLSKFGTEIQDFLDLEQKPGNREYWRTMRVLVVEKQKDSSGRAVKPVSSEIDRLLKPKSYEELQKLERQIDNKLSSDEPIDTDYWQQLLDSLLVYKAKAKLKKLYRDVLDVKQQHLRQSNDPENSLGFKTQVMDRSTVDELAPLTNVAYVRQKDMQKGSIAVAKLATRGSRTDARNDLVLDSKQSSSLFDKEVAKGMEEDEEVFAGEEHVENEAARAWEGQYRSRKPRYFNRVQMGYEWNKYNQTHYDHDNPPPKVVQGYKFHIFYPDLIDPTKAPTYKISREGGRKRGETLAPAGEEDTCIIRFTSGPPYEDIAFRIVDRDWDYSTKHDRGFKSTFEKGILTLHFSFKKIYYRK